MTEAEGRIELTVEANLARALVICLVPAVLVGAFASWNLGLLIVAAAAGNLWFVDRGARQLIAAALARG